MPKSPLFAAQTLAWLFHGEAPAWAGQPAFWVSLHTADPRGQDSQASGECAYPGYRRQRLARTPGGVAIDGAAAANLEILEFPVNRGDRETITHYGIGVAESGAGALLQSFPLDAPVEVSARQAPRVPVRELTVKES